MLADMISKQIAFGESPQSPFHMGAAAVGKMTKEPLGYSRRRRHPKPTQGRGRDHRGAAVFAFSDSDAAQLDTCDPESLDSLHTNG